MIRLNLIPEAIRRAQAWRRRIRRWAAAMIVSTIGVVLPLAVDALQYNSIRALRTENQRLQIELRKLGGEVQAVTAEGGQALLQLEHADALRAKRAWSGILAMIGSRLPASCWLTSVATDPATPGNAPSSSRPAAEGPTAAAKPAVVMMESPRKLRLSGYSPDSALPYYFVKELKESNLFTQVSLNRSVREPALDGQFYRFELECEW